MSVVSYQKLFRNQNPPVPLYETGAGGIDVEIRHVRMMPVSEINRIVDTSASETAVIASKAKQSPEGTGTYQEIVPRDAGSLRFPQ